MSKTKPRKMRISEQRLSWGWKTTQITVMRRMSGNQLVWAAPAFKMWYQKCDGKEPTGTAPFAFYFVFLDFIKTAIKQTQCKAVSRETVREARQKFEVLSSYLSQDLQMLGAWWRWNMGSAPYSVNYFIPKDMRIKIKPHTLSSLHHLSKYKQTNQNYTTKSKIYAKWNSQPKSTRFSNVEH